MYLVLSAADPREVTSWSRFGYDAAGSRTNTTETRITASTVQRLHLLWQAQLPEIADSSPVYLQALAFPDGSMHNVLYMTTRSGSLVALDADSGAQLWVRKDAALDPNKTTTSSPLADPVNGVVYSYTLDGYVHEYNAVTGRELRTNGWPVKVTNMPTSEKESSALNAANGFLYVTTASWGGDAPPYQGHVVAIDLAHGVKHVFNAVCSGRTHLLAPGECLDNGAGIWARQGVVVDPVTGNLFVTTGNGPYTADQGGHDWGESVLELTGDASRLLDSYTPAAPNDLSNQDLDLGSAAPALLPAIPESTTPNLLVQAGKEGALRLLNRQDLSGQGAPGHIGGALQIIDAPDHCPVLTQPAVWTDPDSGAVWVFVSTYCAIGGYRVFTAPHKGTSLRAVWTVNIGASSPVVAGGVLFMASTDPHDQALLALDPRTGHQLWSSADPGKGGTIGNIHWESPIVIGGHLYCTDENGQITAYGLD
jgi:outer membrane protein assembly factor BamB